MALAIEIWQRGLAPDAGIIGPTLFFDHHMAMGGTFQGNTELTVANLLYALVLANRPRTVVETGVNNGSTSLWLALAAQHVQARYVGVDSDAESVKKVTQYFQDVALPGCLIHGDALAELPAIAQSMGGVIDFLFIDDDHTKEHVEAEIRNFVPLMAVGGLICFHDILGIHRQDVWDTIAPLGAVPLAAVLQDEKRQFGGLGLLHVTPALKAQLSQ